MASDSEFELGVPFDAGFEVVGVGEVPTRFPVELPSCDEGMRW